MAIFMNDVINNPIVYQEKKVLTTSDLADFYGCHTKRIRQNFNNNKLRFSDGKHFFSLKGVEKQSLIKSSKISTAYLKSPVLYLWTQKGALLHAKSLNTDKAWESYDYLIDFYFKAKEIVNNAMTDDEIMSRAVIVATGKIKRLEEEKKQLVGKVIELEPKADYHDIVLTSTKTYTTTQIAKELGLTAIKLNKKLHEKRIIYKIRGQWVLYASYQAQGYTDTETYHFPKGDGETGTNMQTVWTEKGRLFIHNTLNSLFSKAG